MANEKKLDTYTDEELLTAIYSEMGHCMECMISYDPATEEYKSLVKTYSKLAKLAKEVTDRKDATAERKAETTRTVWDSVSKIAAAALAGGGTLAAAIVTANSKKYAVDRVIDYEDGKSERTKPQKVTSSAARMI